MAKKEEIELRLPRSVIEFYQQVAKEAGVSLNSVFAVVAALALIKSKPRND